MIARMRTEAGTNGSITDAPAVDHPAGSNGSSTPTAPILATPSAPPLAPETPMQVAREDEVPPATRAETIHVRDVVTPAAVRLAEERDISGIETFIQEIHAERGQRSIEAFRWKHLENPLGRSRVVVAVQDGRIVGLLPFMRWKLTTRQTRVTALRADEMVLRSGLPDELPGEMHACAIDQVDDVDLLFATPRSGELAHYGAAGWITVGELAVYGRASLPSKMFTNAATRAMNGQSSGEQIAEAVAHLVPDDAGVGSADALTTRRTREFLLWRYGSAAAAYRAIRTSDGVAIYRLRPHGRSVQASIVEVFADNADKATSVIRTVRQSTGAARLSAHFAMTSSAGEALRRERFTRVVHYQTLVVLPRKGIVPDPTTRSSWRLTAGDLERI